MQGDVSDGQLRQDHVEARDSCHGQDPSHEGARVQVRLGPHAQHLRGRKGRREAMGGNPNKGEGAVLRTERNMHAALGQRSTWAEKEVETRGMKQRARRRYCRG